MYLQRQALTPPRIVRKKLLIKVYIRCNKKGRPFRTTFFCVCGVGLETLADSEEVLGLQGCTTDKTTIYILLGENLGCV